MNNGIGVAMRAGHHLQRQCVCAQDICQDDGQVLHLRRRQGAGATNHSRQVRYFKALQHHLCIKGMAPTFGYVVFVGLVPMQFEKALTSTGLVPGQVADNSIDMPDANVLIQISSMYGYALPHVGGRRLKH